MRSSYQLLIAAVLFASSCGGEAPTEANNTLAVSISGRVTHNGQPVDARVVLKEEYCRRYDGWVCTHHVSRGIASDACRDGYYEITREVFGCRPGHLHLELTFSSENRPDGWARAVRCTSEPQVVDWDLP